MSMTKKQINALMTIIDLGGGDEKCLEKTDGTLYQCANPAVGIIYHEEIPPKENYRRKRTVFNEVAPHEPEDIFLPRTIRFELEHGEFTLVTGPFPGEIQPSKLAAQLRENLIPNPNGTTYNPNVVELTAQTENGTKYASLFNPRNIRLAVEAVGGKPRLYLGNSNRNSSYQVLIVDSGPVPFEMEKNNMAIVMPIRRP